MESRRRGWTEEEDRLIIELQKQWGNHWAAIAQVAKEGSVERRSCRVAQPTT